MEDSKKNENTKKENIQEKNENLLVLEKPIIFEGNEVKEIDLSSLEQATTNDLVKARRMVMANSFNPEGANLERTVEFACYLASVVTNKPVELFGKLKAVDGMNLRRVVMNFLF